MRIGQIGARLGEVRADWLYPYVLAVMYFGLTVVVARRRDLRDMIVSA